MQSISLVFFFFCFTATGIFGFSPPDSGIALVNQVEDDVPSQVTFETEGVRIQEVATIPLDQLSWQRGRYTADVVLDAPIGKQVLKLLVDTGSADTWFISDRAQDCITDPVRFQDNPATCTDLGKPFTITFGAGNQFKGKKCLGTFSIIDSDSGAVVLKNQEFGLVTECLDAQGKPSTDRVPVGVLALDFGERKGGTKPIINNLVSMSYGPKFTLWITANGDSGQLVIGAENPSHSDGDVEYYNMFFKEATYALVTQIIIGGKPVGGSNYALIDYGAPIFFAKETFVAEFYKKVDPNSSECPHQRGAGKSYCVPCKETGDLPPVDLQFSKQGMDQWGKEWKFKDFWVKHTPDLCEGNMRSHPKGDTPPYYLIGVSFLKNFVVTLVNYMLIDVGKLEKPPKGNRIGFVASLG